MKLSALGIEFVGSMKMFVKSTLIQIKAEVCFQLNSSRRNRYLNSRLGEGCKEFGVKVLIK